MRAPLICAAAVLVAAMGLAGGEGETVELNGIVVSEPFARSAGPAARSAAGYLAIANAGAADDRLIGAESEAAARLELHAHRLDNGVARMIPLEDGIPLPAGETVVLEPGGMHLMFMGLRDPWGAEGGVVVTLHFEQAGSLPVTFAVDRAGHTHDPHAQDDHPDERGRAH
jgi:periplasmic copper chaperone A